MFCAFITISPLLFGAAALKTDGSSRKDIHLTHELPSGAAVPPVGLQSEGVPKHPLPQQAQPALRAPSWTVKIPDIVDNLALAQQWMTLSSTLGATNTKDAEGTLLEGKALDGALFMVADVKDAPKYYDCGLAMNTAWSALARNPCSMQTWTASDRMKEAVPECSKLRVGKRYTDSYRALKIDQDTWCGGPECSPKCAEGVQCIRSQVFPFSPTCESYPATLNATANVDKAESGAGWLQELTCGVMLLVCICFAMIPTPKDKVLQPPAGADRVVVSRRI